MYYLKFDGRIISGVDLLPCKSGAFSVFKDDAHKPLLFEDRSPALALLTFLSLMGEELGMYELCYTEYAEDVFIEDGELICTAPEWDRPCRMSHEFFSCDCCNYARILGDSTDGKE